MSGDKLWVSVTEWRPLSPPRNTLVGFCDVRIAEMRVSFLDVAVHIKGNKAWAGLPSKAWLKDGIAVRRDDNKIIYQPVIKFDTARILRVFGDRGIRSSSAAPPRCTSAALRTVSHQRTRCAATRCERYASCVGNSRTRPSSSRPSAAARSRPTPSIAW